jgi:hypothetical protein
MEGDVLSGIDEALRRLEQMPDAGAREQSRQLVGAVLALHREGLSALLEHFCATPEARRQLVQVARQEPLHSLLALHDLHPEDQRERIERALEGLRPQVEVSLVACEPQGVVLRLHEPSKGCANTAARQRQLIENAVVEAAPDAGPIHIEEPLNPNLQLQLRVV